MKETKRGRDVSRLVALRAFPKRSRLAPGQGPGVLDAREASPPGLLLCFLSSACASHLSAAEGLDVTPRPPPLLFSPVQRGGEGEGWGEHSDPRCSSRFPNQRPRCCSPGRCPSRKAKQTTTTTTTHTAPLITGAMPGATGAGPHTEALGPFQRAGFKTLYLREGVMKRKPKSR